MKITRTAIRQFEHDQKSWGTEVAIYNLLWTNAAGLLRDLGVKGVRTSGEKRSMEASAL